MDRCEHVILGDTLRDQDRVFVVVAVPRHKRDDHVFTKGQFAHIGRWTVCDDFALQNRVTHFDQRTLVDTGVLVRTLELAHTVDINACVTEFQIFCCTDNDTLGIHLVDDPGAMRHDRRARVARHNFFDPGANQWRFGAQSRNRLTLHVRAHQGAVSIVVFEERDERGRNRNQLFRAHVDKINRIGGRQCVVAGFPGADQIVVELAVFIEVRVGLRHGVTHFFGRRHVVNFVSHLTFLHHTIRRFDKAVFVHTGKGRQRVDQTNVWPFRRFNRTHAAIVRWVNVANLKARTFTGQTAWAKRRKATFVRHFGERVGLVHELRQLRRAEEFAYRSSSRFRVDQILRHHRVDFDR